MGGRLRIMLVCFALAAAVGAGCGGDDETTSGGSGSASNGSANEGATLSKAEFVAQGNQICLDARQEIGDEIKDLLEEEEAAGGRAGVDTAEEIAENIVLPHFKTQNEELRELPVPSGDGAEVEAVLNKLESEVAEAEADSSVLLGSTVSPFLESRKLAIKYGLTKCGRI